MTETKRSDTEYPTTLDVVRREGREYQVVAMSQTGNPSEDLYVLKDPGSGEIHRVKGARFTPTTPAEPGKGEIHKRDEGVRVTGNLGGGSRRE